MSIAVIIAALQKAETAALAYGNQPPPPPPPPVGDLSWFLSKAPMTITNIGTQVLQSMNPWAAITPSKPDGHAAGTGGFSAILAASGMVFCPWMGRAGWLVVFGGGHDDYHGNDMYAYDLFLQQWLVLKAPQWPLFKDTTGYHANQTSGELWLDSLFTLTSPKQPGTGHNYGMPFGLSPNAEFTQGAVVMPAIPSLTPGGQRNGRVAHAFDLAKREWVRYSANEMHIQGPGYSGSFIDHTRNRAIVPMQGGLAALDLSTKLFTKVIDLPSNTNYMMWAHYVPQDKYVAVWLKDSANALAEIWIVDPTTWATATRRVVAWPNTTRPGGACWSTLLGGFAYYHGRGEQTMVTVRPPATGDVRYAAWQLDTLTFTGDMPAIDTTVGAGAHCKRLLEHPAAGGMVWLGNTRQVPQFFKVT